MGNNKIRFRLPLVGKICAAVLSAVLLTSTLSNNAVLIAGADTKSEIEALEEKIKEINAKNQQRESQIKNFNGNIASNEKEMAVVNEQIDGTNAEIQMKGELITLKMQEIQKKMDEIDAVELTIIDKENEIKQKQQQIAQLEQQNKENLEKFAKLARAMYMTDSSNVMPVLNGSDDWYDYFVYSDVVRNISGQNAEFMLRLRNSIQHQETLIDALNADIVALEVDKVGLNRQKTDFEKELAEFEQEKKDLQEYADTKMTYLNNLASANKSLQSKVDGLKTEIHQSNEEVEELNKQIEEIIRKAQQNGSGEVYTGGYMWPVSAKFQRITTYFGYDGWRGGMHYGIDIAGAGIGGTSIFAAQSGTVIKVSNTCTHNFGKNYRDSCGGGYGNYIIVDHGGGMSTLYAHCGSIKVKEGQFVSRGEAIGAVGTTGWSTGYHLHFEVRKNGKATNPFDYQPYTYKY
ncbi:MAG: murein hydrolase activator EnvC family protein [Oscillospiraceae bacterium]